MVVHSRRYGKNATYTHLGCGVRRSRGASICSNARTVNAQKLTEAFTTALREALTRDGMVERFITAVKKRYSRPKTSGLADLEKRVTQAETRVRNATDALVKMGFSPAMAEATKRRRRRWRSCASSWRPPPGRTSPASCRTRRLSGRSWATCSRSWRPIPRAARRC